MKPVFSVKVSALILKVNFDVYKSLNIFRVLVGMAGFFQRTKKSVTSLYTDPFKWGVVKSLGIFIFGVYIARDLKGISIDGASSA